MYVQAEFQFLSFEGYNRQLAAKMQNLGGVLCSICLDYMVKPVTTKCGHSFCEYCLDEYFLLMDTCAVCEKQIRNSLSYASNVLGEFVENFVREQHGDKWAEYQKRQEEAAKWKHNKRIGGLKVGMKVDIRDKHHIWCEGVVIRIISRVGESHKFLKVQYLDYEDKVQQDLRVISERLANHGFYTTRGDIPRYKEKIKSIKNSPLIMNPI